MAQISAMVAISASDFTSRRAWISGVASTGIIPGSFSCRRAKSFIGIRRLLSLPIGMPTAVRPRNASANRETPSSSACGEDQLRTSSIQVVRIKAAPISGMTAMGLPDFGTTRNQGRVGLNQNSVRKPVK